VNLFIQAPAEEDILRQVVWYAEQGLPHIARRFLAAVVDSIDALLAMPEAGPPRPSSNPRLAGLRAWPVKGFDEF
jgi:toxin ParE1/3/4